MDWLVSLISGLSLSALVNWLIIYAPKNLSADEALTFGFIINLAAAICLASPTVEYDFIRLCLIGGLVLGAIVWPVVFFIISILMNNPD